jgi:hypothetical protein
MTKNPPRATRLVLLRGTLLASGVLTAAAAAGTVGFAAYLFAEGYSGGSSQQSVAPLAFPLALLILAVVGMPLTLACALSWAGYRAAARKNRQLP